MGANFSLEVCSWAYCSREQVVRFLLLAGSSPATVGRDFHLYCGEPLAVPTALLVSTSQVSVMTFFPGTLSVFLAYLYTWYWFRFPSVKETRRQRCYWKRLFRAWLHVTRYLHYRYFT